MASPKKNLVTKFKIGEWAVKIETYVFSVYFVYYAAVSLIFVITKLDFIQYSLNLIFQGKASGTHFLALNTLIFHFLMIFFNLIIVYGLIIRKDLKKCPDNLQEIVIPFIATFNLLFLNLLRFIPEEGNVLLFPQQIIPFCSALGAMLSTSGIVVSILALIKLKNSFGIFIQVRSIICTGIYKYVRHPIYLGYFLNYIGCSLLNGRLFSFILSGFSIFILVYRAKLEETKLAKYSEEYRAYMKKTPGILPRLF